MKKAIYILLSLLLIFQCSNIAFAQEIKVEIDKKPISFDVKPLIEDGRVLVPFRKIFEELGLRVDWKSTLKIASAYTQQRTVSIKAGSSFASVNGEISKLAVSARIVNGRMMVPLRFISEAFGNEVSWNSTSKLVSIKSTFRTPAEQAALPVVGSYEKLLSIFEYAQKYDTGIRYFTDVPLVEREFSKDEAVQAPESGGSAGSGDYSQTNIQVSGVDEADIVKTDGSYIYQVRNNSNTISIVEANKGELSLASEVKIDGNFSASELYYSDNKLIVLGSTNQPMYKIMDQGVDSLMMPYYYNPSMKVIIYDISDRKNPEVARTLEIDGYYLSSRLIDNKLYLTANKYIYPIYKGEETGLQPEIYDSVNGVATKVPYIEIRYFPNCVESNYLITAGLDLNDLGKKADVDVYLGSGQNVYVSRDNMYVAYTSYDYHYESNIDGTSEIYYPVYDINTALFKFTLDNGSIEYVNKGEVPGNILNQFSMDENDDYFRIATTTGETWSTGENTSKNNLYVLDQDMTTIGKLEGLAPTEKIYSVRFMGNRAYMVTYRQVDPFYVIDLTDPEKPDILGYLKIPGFSNYLHPYDENHIIGFGKDVEEQKNGTAVISGMKIALFDVSDVSNPVEVSKVTIGDQGTDSELLYNHKALLFSKEKSLMALPITEMREGGDGWSRFYYQGAYVYNIDLEQGFTLRGKATHLTAEDYEKAGDYWYDSSKNIKRIIYIGDYLYTLSDSQIDSHNINNVSTVDKLIY